MFTHHCLAYTSFNFDKVVTVGPWPTILLCAALFLLTLLVVPFRRKFDLLFRSLYSQRHFSLMMREGRVLQERFFIFTLIFDTLVFALGVLIIMQHYDNILAQKMHVMLLFLLLFAMMMAMFWVKYLVNIIYTNLFEHPKELYPMSLYKFIFVTDAAILLFPFLILVQFTHHFFWIYCYIPLFLMLFVLYVYKLMKINPRQINLFNYFVYFCTLEILPYLLLAKLTAMI